MGYAIRVYNENDINEAIRLFQQAGYTKFYTLVTPVTTKYKDVKYVVIGHSGNIELSTGAYAESDECTILKPVYNIPTPIGPIYPYIIKSKDAEMSKDIINAFIHSGFILDICDYYRGEYYVYINNRGYIQQSYDIPDYYKKVNLLTDVEDIYLKCNPLKIGDMIDIDDGSWNIMIYNGNASHGCTSEIRNIRLKVISVGQYKLSINTVVNCKNTPQYKFNNVIVMAEDRPSLILMTNSYVIDATYKILKNNY